MYGWTMSQKLSVHDFKWDEDISEFDLSFIKSCNEESNERYFLEVDIQYPEDLCNLKNNSSFLPERIKI